MSRSDLIVGLIEAIKLGSLGVDPVGRSMVSRLPPVQVPTTVPKQLGMLSFYEWRQGNKTFYLVHCREKKTTNEYLYLYMGPHSMKFDSSENVENYNACVMYKRMSANDEYKSWISEIKDKGRISIKFLDSIKFSLHWIDKDATSSEDMKLIRMAIRHQEVSV